MKFLKHALEGLYLLNIAPNRSEKFILSNVKFYFPLPMFFFFAGIGAHILLDIPWMNKNVASSQVLTLVFGISFSLTAYPFFLKFIFPLLDTSKINKQEKRKKGILFFIYLWACFIGLALLGWLTNFTRADEFRQAF